MGKGLEDTTPALSATGVSVSQEQAGVRFVLYHAELIRISQVSGNTGHKEDQKQKKRKEGKKRKERRRECRKN